MIDINQINRELADKSPLQIVRLALQNGNKPVLTTNFRPYEVAILHVVTQVFPEIPVIWCDTGYNTPQTYEHAEYLIEKTQSQH